MVIERGRVGMCAKRSFGDPLPIPTQASAQLELQTLIPLSIDYTYIWGLFSLFAKQF